MHRKRAGVRPSSGAATSGPVAGFGAFANLVLHLPRCAQDGRASVVMVKIKIVHCDLARESICRSNRLLVMDSLVLNSLKRAGHESEHSPRGSA